MSAEKDYMDYVRTLPCCVTQFEGESDPHHIIGYNWLTGKGGSKKGSFTTCIPIKHELHVELHDIGWQSFEKKHNMSQLEMVIATIIKAEKAGVISINKIK